MTKEELKKIVEKRISKILQTLNNKNNEYATADDVFHNFKKARELFRCNTKEYALLGMLNKHLVSVIDMVEKYEKDGILPCKNLVDEKIGDSINYLILLESCFLESIDLEILKMPQQKESNKNE